MIEWFSMNYHVKGRRVKIAKTFFFLLWEWNTYQKYLKVRPNFTAVVIIITKYTRRQAVANPSVGLTTPVVLWTVLLLNTRGLYTDVWLSVLTRIINDNKRYNHRRIFGFICGGGLTFLSYSLAETNIFSRFRRFRLLTVVATPIWFQLKYQIYIYIWVIGT